MKAIIVKNISKSFGPVQAVIDLSFEVEANTCFGLLGPNGAGKTTMMKMLYARCIRDKDHNGSISIFGYDPADDELAIKHLSGVVGQENNLDDELNVLQNLWIYSKFYGLTPNTATARINDLLGFLELSEKKNARIKELSGGMQRRLVVARALMNNPKLLILDEPTTGLDPQMRHLIWDKLRQLKRRGTTVLLTTHYMEEAFAICDKVLIMHKGRKVMQDSPQALIEENVERFVLEAAGVASPHEQPDNDLLQQVRVDHSRETTRFYCNDIERLKRLAVGLEGAHYLRQTNLEDVFLKATGRGLNE